MTMGLMVLHIKTLAHPLDRFSVPLAASTQ